MRIMLRTWLRVSECLSLCPADPPIISLRPEVTGNKVKRGREVPHPRRLGGVPRGSGVVSRAKDGERPLIDQAVAGNSPVYGPGWESPLVVAQGVAGKPGLFLPGRTVYFCPFQPGVQQDDALRLRQGLGERAGGQESGPAGGAAGPRRLLPGKYPSRRSQRGQERPRRPFWNCWTWWSRGTPWWSPTLTGSPGG